MSGAPTTLKTQMTLALGGLLLLFALAILYALSTLDRQRADDTLLRLAGQLQLTEQHMAMQAMNYKENAPRDYETYYRDIRLYYRDLMQSKALFDAISNGFVSGRFDASLTGDSMPDHQPLDGATRDAALALQTAWDEVHRGLNEKLGPDPEEPRLEWASEWILDNHTRIATTTSALVSAMEIEVERRHEQTRHIGRLSLVGGLLVVAAVMFWFYRQVLRPLNVAVAGVRTVAAGDFSHRIPAPSNNELGWLIENFNRLSNRLDSLLQVITQLQRGNDLDETLSTAARTLSTLVPLDWIGILVKGTDGRMYLEQAYADGQPDSIGRVGFELQNSLLEECLRTGQPLHVADVPATSQLSENFDFLRTLAQRGRNDAIFLPISHTDPIVGVMVFANRQPNTYRTEHIELLTNLSLLLSVSFGHTLKLEENARLAAIGQFSSGIVHEIRNPLATIKLALAHLRSLDTLAVNSAKRVRLADFEVERMSRLLDDILSYAKPLQLDFQPVALAPLLDELQEDPGLQPLLIESSPDAPLPVLLADADRLRQILLNLLRNAREAAGDDAAITLKTTTQPDQHMASMEIHNATGHIPADGLQKIFEPFYTTKSGGTGLGLSIVQRMVAAHGGTITIDSNEKTGTRVTLVMPVVVE